MKISHVSFRRLMTGSIALAMAIGCWINSDIYQDIIDASEIDPDRRSLASENLHYLASGDIPSLSVVERALYHDSTELRRKTQKMNLRVACFGDSDTWGVLKFDNQNENQTDMNYWHTRFDFDKSYCSQLGSNVDNYAIPSSGPNYHATCLESMVGEKIYDVITVDFPLVKAELVGELVERLRRRYPNAMILMLDRFLLKKVKMQDPIRTRRQITIEEYMIRLRIVDAKRKRQWGAIKDSMRVYNREKFEKFVKEKKVRKERNKRIVPDLSRRPLRIKAFEMQYRNSQKEKLEELHKKHKAVPVYIGDEEEIEDSLLMMNDYYYDDGNSLNVLGHIYVANTIHETILEQKGFQASDEVGDFNGGDACHVWYTNKDAASEITWDRKSELVNYVDIRNGVEFSSSSDIVVNNPFEDERTLYMSYMVTPGPEQLCRRATFDVNGQKITINTIGSSDYQKNSKIVTPRTVPLTKIPPGKNRITVEELDDDVPLPFRMMGLTITNEKQTPIEYEFLQKFWWKGLIVSWGKREIEWA